MSVLLIGWFGIVLINENIIVYTSLMQKFDYCFTMCIIILACSTLPDYVHFYLSMYTSVCSLFMCICPCTHLSVYVHVYLPMYTSVCSCTRVSPLVHICLFMYTCICPCTPLSVCYVFVRINYYSMYNDQCVMVHLC